jgi:DNA polymerase I-like protein with 3'-5' exonuclease and polymerase domains
LFVPDDGKKLFTGDYSVAELRTLAATCRARFGTSRLGEVIAKGADPHAFTAATIQGKSMEEFLALKDSNPSAFKQARQAAKAVNFGIPGGLGAKTLVAYARDTYGVSLTAEESEEFRKKLINDVYPELNDRDGYLADNSMAILADNLGVREREAWDFFDRSGNRNPVAARGVSNVVRGKSTASPYYQAVVWEALKRLVRLSKQPDPTLIALIDAKRGGEILHSRLYRRSVATLTGRIRANVGYTDGKNTPFQSLAADGAKLALWKLLYSGFDVYGFVHDEILVALPQETATQDSEQVAIIMKAAMADVLGQVIPADCEYVVEACWKKP